MHEKSMEICAARQPVFTKNLNIYGYELLSHNTGRDEEGDTATDNDRSGRTVVNSFHDLGIERITSNKRGFVSFTEKLLLDMYATILPPQILVIELVKTILPTSGVIAACRELRNKGYLIALDGFRPEEAAFLPLLEAADIVGIEFHRENTGKCRQFVLEMQKSHPRIQLLAKKLENLSEFKLAQKCDFTLFHGNFFSKPATVKNLTILPAPRRHQTLQLIQLSFNPVIDFRAASDIIKQDIALSYRLLRVINSAFFGLRHTVSNIRQAISILGEREFKKLITMISLFRLSENKPTELITLCLIRARFLELLAPGMGMAEKADDMFLMGLMSLMDAVMGIPMMDVLKQTNISPHIAKPLLKREGDFGNLLNLIVCYEQGHWDRAEFIAGRYAVSIKHIFDVYIQAIEWTRQIYAYTQGRGAP